MSIKSLGRAYLHLALSLAQQSMDLADLKLDRGTDGKNHTAAPINTYGRLLCLGMNMKLANVPNYMPRH